jgi:uncharacterized protein YkwD
MRLALGLTLLTLAAAGGDARAQERCADRDVEFEAAPEAMRAALACEVARVRAREGAQELRADAQLDLAAARHATDMFERRYFSHTSPGGGDLADRGRRAGYAVRRCAWRLGELLAWGVGARSTAAGTVRAWLDSPPHRRILLSSRYRELGLGTQGGTPYARFGASGITVALVLGQRDC